MVSAGLKGSDPHAVVVEDGGMGQIIALPREPRHPRGVDDNVAHLVAHGLVHVDLEQQPGRTGAARAAVARGGNGAEARLRVQQSDEPD